MTILVVIAAYTYKEDLKQVVEDGMLIHNRNFIQSAELVRSELLCTVLVSLSSYCFILMNSFAGLTAIRNMTYQHQEFHTRLRDAERLRIYAQSIVSDHRVLSTSLAKVESSSWHWENEAKGRVERMARAKAERDATSHDASMARTNVNMAGSARAKVESELAKVQTTLVVVEEARRKAEGGRQG